MSDRLTGLIAAVFTPMHEDGSLNAAGASAVVERNVTSGTRGLFVCGSTGEGASLTLDERRTIAEAYVEASAGRLPVIVHVGHNCLEDAAALAGHAAAVGATAIAAAPPSYFRPEDVSSVLAGLRRVADAAPDLPLHYYHIPRLTGVELRIADLLAEAADRLPTLRGVKFSSTELDDLVECAQRFGDRYDLLFGADEMLLAGLACGAGAAVGSTYNFAAPVYNAVIEAFGRGDLIGARERQHVAVRMVRAILRHPAQPALKATMRLSGIDCGPPRLPLRPLDEGRVAQLQRELRGIEELAW